MGQRIRGKVVKDFNEKNIIIILGDDKKQYYGHWDPEKQERIKRGKRVYFIPGEPEIMLDGSVSKYPIALDIKRYSELDLPVYIKSKRK